MDRDKRLRCYDERAAPAGGVTDPDAPSTVTAVDGAALVPLVAADALDAAGPAALPPLPTAVDDDDDAVPVAVVADAAAGGDAAAAAANAAADAAAAVADAGTRPVPPNDTGIGSTAPGASGPSPAVVLKCS